MRNVSLAAALFAFWLALSGHYTAFLMAAGAASAAVCAAIAARVNFTDANGHPVHLLARTLSYYPWLFVEVIKSAWNVARMVLNPRLPVTPTFTVVPASQRTEAGLATYGNSITLTPGTLTVAVRSNAFEVHALSVADARGLEAGGMDRRVAKFEGGA